MWGDVIEDIIAAKKSDISRLISKNDVFEVKDLTDDFYSKLPPIEAFASITDMEKLNMFYKTLTNGIILYGHVISTGYDQFIVKVVATCDEEPRDIAQLNIKAFCKFDEIPDYYMSDDNLKVGDFIRAVVISVVDKTIYLSLFEPTSPDLILNNRKLGKVDEYELPKYYRKKPESSFIRSLEDSIEFKNRKGIDAVFTLIGLDVHSQKSLLDDDSLRNGCELKNVTIQSLRNQQDMACALQSVRRAKRYREQRKLRDALKCVEYGLGIYADCWEAVAEKGRILWAKGKTERAKKCFDEAVKLSSSDECLVKEIEEITCKGQVESVEFDEPEEVKPIVPSPSIVPVKTKRVVENMLSLPIKRKPIDVTSINPGSKVEAEDMSLADMKKFLEVLKKK